MNHINPEPLAWQELPELLEAINALRRPLSGLHKLVTNSDVCRWMAELLEVLFNELEHSLVVFS